MIFEANGQREYPPHIHGAKEFTYKTVGEIKLNLWILNPENHKLTVNAPAIVFFFWGRLQSWKSCTICKTLRIFIDEGNGCDSCRLPS